MKSIIKVDKDNNAKIEYIGYIQMLDKIISLIDKVSYENKMVLIDKYVDILKIINGGKDD